MDHSRTKNEIINLDINQLEADVPTIVRSFEVGKSPACPCTHWRELLFVHAMRTDALAVHPKKSEWRSCLFLDSRHMYGLTWYTIVWFPCNWRNYMSIRDLHTRISNSVPKTRLIPIHALACIAWHLLNTHRYTHLHFPPYWRSTTSIHLSIHKKQQTHQSISIP